MLPSGFPAYHRCRARLRRIQERLSLRNRLVLSHVMVLLLALLAMAAISALIEVWLGFDDVEGDVVLQIGLLSGVAAAFPASVALSRFLLRPLDRVRAATSRTSLRDTTTTSSNSPASRAWQRWSKTSTHWRQPSPTPNAAAPA